MTVLFRAKTNEGYIIKILIELLQNNIRIACINIQRDGMRIRMMDNNRLVLLDVVMECMQFNIYELSSDELNIGINLNHLYKMLKSIKKKDALMFSIESDDPDNLIMTIFPKDSKRVVRAIVRIQPIQAISIPLPTGYSNPINVISSDFQQSLKDINVISESLRVIMRRYSLTIDCDAQGIYSKGIQFGEEEDDSPIQYDDVFNMEQFIRILKITGLSETIQIYGSSNLPLKVRTQIGRLGTLTVFIKSKQQIHE